MKRFPLWVSVLGVLILGGGVLYPIKKDTQIILDEIAKLNETMNLLDRKVTSLTVDVATLYKRVEVMEAKISAIAKNEADFAESRESLLLSLQVFKEELTEIKDRLKRLAERPGERALSQPENSPDSGQTSAANLETAVSQDPSSVYYTAYSDYIKENYRLAIEGFKQYLRLFPDSGLADNSLYWIGECYYAQKKYAEAVNTFNELISKYRDGDKVPATMLKKSYALLEMGKQSEGNMILKDLISRFPLSEEASLARQRIKENSE